MVSLENRVEASAYLGGHTPEASAAVKDDHREPRQRACSLTAARAEARFFALVGMARRAARAGFFF